ncbi:hypothetical protein [Pseudomonas aeruginosa]|uniref:hypothetical protein n=1 Tax=Pseudomonas aeruginosa TaxID=287 RepID=UPI00244B2D5B|nr:hypothetical protein [Pseudomonas aeruginosa]MDH1421355.1 hypothetical protein [Pseudomonas aeruginosa]
METPDDTREKEKKKASPLDMDRMQTVLEELRKAMTGNLEDIEQEELVKVVQRNRAFILEYAMSAYLDNPKNAHLLEGVTQIIAQIEKTVRDDRKERAKKKENEGNRLAFNQMLEAMERIQSGGIKLPTFEFSHFVLDPSKPLPLDPTLSPITEEELVQGNQLVNIDGEEI